MVVFKVRTPIASGVLALNRNYCPVRIISSRRAFAMIVAGIAEVVDDALGDYQSYSFGQWDSFSVEIFSNDQVRDKYHWLRTVNRHYPIPKIIRVLNYGRLPPTVVRLNRINIALRDRSTCQYCGTLLRAKEITLDHVLPRSRGGGMSWSNIVCCCMPCNTAKGQRTPAEAAMPLLTDPKVPKIFDLFCMPLEAESDLEPSWQPFLGAV